MDKSLGLLGLLAAGVGLYFIAENTPEGKKVISNIHQGISNIKTGITEVSTTPTVPDLSKGRCPKGMYLDQTDGIYRCHSAGGIRELNPNVKMFNPQWQNAWAAEPNMTQPLVQPDINKQIESEIKKKHEKEVKHQKNLDTKRLIREKGNVVAAQVECPKDLKDVPCGGHCYKNGHLMAVDCSGQKNKPKPTKKPSLIIPPNFPNQVVITPGEEPYPEDVGGPDNTTDVNPSYPELPHQPEIGPVTPEPPRQPQIGQPTPEPPRQPQIGPLQPIGVPFHPFTPWQGFAGAVGGCRQVNSHSGGSSFKSCRVQASNEYMKSKIGNNGYRIDCVLDIGDHTGEHNQECSITSGGPGSNKGLCCGFTARINLNNGTLRLESEDWSQGGTTGAKYCEGPSCVNGGLSSITNGASVYGKKGIKFAWVVTRSGNSATYYAEATGPAGTVRTNPITNPHAHKSGGPPIIPFQQIAGGKPAEDSHRIRVDSAKTVNFNQPSVTVLARTGYFGDLGFIEDEDFLI